MSPEEAEFVDRLGLFMEMLGGSRTMGRVYGWLLICDPPTAVADRAGRDAVGQQGLGQHRRPPAAGRRADRAAAELDPSAQLPGHARRVQQRAQHAAVADEARDRRCGLRALAAGEDARRTTGAARRLPRLLRVLRTGLPRRVDAAVERLPRREEDEMTTNQGRLQLRGLALGGVDEPGHPVPAGIRKSFATADFGRSCRRRSRRPHRLRLQPNTPGRAAVGQPVPGRRCAPRNSMTGRPISCAVTQTPSCCTSAAAWTPGRSGSIHPRPCSGSTSISPASSTCGASCTTRPTRTA